MGMTGCYMLLKPEEINGLARGTLAVGALELSGREALDIDKSWQALHYMLCGGAIDDGDPPAGYVVPMMDSQFTEFEEFGAFWLSAGQAAEALAYMDEVTRERILACCDLSAMAEDEVYPIVEDDEPEEFFEYLWDYLQQIRGFYRYAVAKGNGILFYIS